MRKREKEAHEWLGKLYNMTASKSTEKRFTSKLFEIKPYESWVTISGTDDMLFLNMCIEKAMNRKTE